MHLFSATTPGIRTARFRRRHHFSAGIAMPVKKGKGKAKGKGKGKGKGKKGKGKGKKKGT